MSCFENQVVAITGAGSGIDRCLAQQCAEKGARLALSDVNSHAEKRQPQYEYEGL
jgi:NAD(P)-dependent dehydrogenase (short-subunit alcohol dehydrogenase family)